MSEMFVQYAGTPIRDIHAGPLRDMLKIVLAEADYIMGVELADDHAFKLTKWMIEFLYEKYGYLPFMHIREAMKAGSMGQRGGTFKLIPRNIAIWISEQDKIYQEQRMTDMRKIDAERRNREMHGAKADPLIGTAVNIKVRWFADERITSEQYDSFPYQKIYDLLKSGVPESQIHPRDVVPNYQEKI